MMSSAAQSSAALPREVAAPVATRTRRMRPLLVAALAVTALACGAWYGLDWWQRGRFVQSTDDAYVGGDITPLAPHVGGFVAAVLVADNQRVAAGQVLLRLDPRDFRTALDHAEAALSARRAARDGLRAQLAQQQATIRQLLEDLAAKSAEASFAAEDATRYAALARTAAGSRQDWQRAATRDRAAQATVAAASAGLDAARQQLRVLQAGLAEAEAGVAQAQADRTAARLNLGYTELRAPIDGYVGNRAAQVGAYVAAGTYLLSVVPAAGLWVDANFKEDQLARMAAGQPATVSADAMPGVALRGRVASLAPGTGAVFSVIPPENATGNFTKIVQRVPVRIALDGAPDAALLRPGLSATVRVDTRP